MWLVDIIKKLWNKVVNFFRRIINGVLNFFRDIIGWFDNLLLRRDRDIPFVVNKNGKAFKELLDEAPIKQVGIFQGNYDEETDEITEGETIDADGLDDATRNLLKDEDLVILS